MTSFADAKDAAPAEACKCAGAPENLTLFTTKTCPNCRMAKSFLDKAGIAYNVVIADEDVETAQKFEIRQAPTLVVEKDGGLEKIVNLSNIKKFIEDLQNA